MYARELLAPKADEGEAVSAFEDNGDVDEDGDRDEENVGNVEDAASFPRKEAREEFDRLWVLRTWLSGSSCLSSEPFCFASSLRSLAIISARRPDVGIFLFLHSSFSWETFCLS